MVPALVLAVYIPLGILQPRNATPEVNDVRGSHHPLNDADGNLSLPFGMYTSGHDGPAKCARRAPRGDERADL
jgi:hypothetical protein